MLRSVGADDLEEFHRVGCASFGVRFDPAIVELRRRLIDPMRFLLADVDGVAAGAAGSFRFDLTLPGGGSVPVCGVSDVGVLPTHRRRGLLTALLRRLLAEAAARGEPTAVLSASQATIYGRFGFGVAVRGRGVSVSASRSAFRDDAPVASGGLRLVDRPSAGAVLADVHRRSRRCGTLSRSEAWWDVVLGDTETFIGGHRDHLVMVHEDHRGSADAYAVYRMEERWLETGPAHRLEVREAVGVDAAAELAVWRALLDHDLVDHVHAVLPVDHVLGDALADPRALVTESDRDVLWCRPLDVVALLSARTYGVDATIVVEVTDGFRPETAGRYRLEVSTGQGSCRRDDGATPDLVLDVAELGACALGGGSFRRLVRAGRVQEIGAGSATVADALFSSDPLPWTDTRF